MAWNIKEHKESIVVNLISNALWYIITFILADVALWVPMIRGLYQSSVNEGYIIPIYAFVLAAISFVIMFVVMIVSIIVAIRIYNNRDNNVEIKTDLIFDDLEIELYFKDRENIVTYLTYDCSVNKEGYNDKFKKNIIWTGGKYNYTKIIEANGQYILTDSDRKTSPHTYIVDFNKSFSIGEKIYFKLETSVNDEEKFMTPVFSHMVKHQTNKFSINVTVPENLITNVRATVYRDLGRTIEVPNDIKLQHKNVGNLVQYSYTMETPKLLNNYCIEWDFS